MYGTVLVPTDGSEASLRAAREAARIARETGATLHAVYVIDESASSLLLTDKPLADLMELLGEEGQQALDAIRGEVGDLDVVTEVVRGMGVTEGVLEYADAQDVDLIVMGTRGRHGLDHVLGSTTERVLARTSLPVLVISADEESEKKADETDG